jgi:hypothetical protein
MRRLLSDDATSTERIRSFVNFATYFLDPKIIAHKAFLASAVANSKFTTERIRSVDVGFLKIRHHSLKVTAKAAACALQQPRR